MSTNDIVPRNSAERAAWLLHFAAKIDAHAAALAASADDIKALKADAAMVDWIVKVVPSVRASSQQFTAFRDELLDGPIGVAPQAAPVAPTFSASPAAIPAGVVLRARAFAQRIKKAAGYTEAIGRDLGIVASASANVASSDAAKPTFRATALPHNEVRLDWVKAGHSGVTIQGQRAGEADWVDLGKDNYSPYVDGRSPLTPGAIEPRQYRMRYLDKDNEVGEWSDVVSAVATA